MLLKKIPIFVSVLAVLYAVYSCGLMPVYVETCANVLYSDGYIPFLLEIAMGFLDLVIFSWIFGFMLLAFEKNGVKNALVYLAVAVLTDAVRYYIMLITESGVLNDFILTLVFDAVQLIAVLILWYILKKKKSFGTIAAFIPAIVIALFKIAMRVCFDIFYGAPEDVAEAMLMLAYYFSDLLCGVIVLLITALIRKILKRTEV